jgi:hypothetical protein
MRHNPSIRPLRTRVAGGRLLVLLLAMACGDRPPDPPQIVDRTTAGDSPTVAPTVAGDAAPVVPSTFAVACLDGDPAEGTNWRVERVDTALVPLTLEPIAGLASRDSARLAARIARAVDVLPSDTTLADFRGLPVVVRAAWRISPTITDTLVIAAAARRLPMESNPLEESFFLVAARGLRSGVRDPLVERWVLRDVADEDVIASRELVAAYAGPEDELTLVLVHDADEGARAELLVRRAGAWHVEWSGPLPSCVVP